MLRFVVGVVVGSHVVAFGWLSTTSSVQKRKLLPRMKTDLPKAAFPHVHPDIAQYLTIQNTTDCHLEIDRTSSLNGLGDSPLILDREQIPC